MHILLEALEKIVFYFPKVHLDIVGSISGALPKNVLVGLDENEKVANLKYFYEPGLKTGKILSYFEQLQSQLTPELSQHLSKSAQINITI